jgi:hypothetical protein
MWSSGYWDKLYKENDKGTIKFKIVWEKIVTDYCRFHCRWSQQHYHLENLHLAKKSHVSCHAWSHNKRGTLGCNGSWLCVCYVNGRSLVGAPACQKWLILFCEEMMGIWWLPYINDHHHCHCHCHHSHSYHCENPKSFVTDFQGKNPWFSAWYSKPSPLAGATFLKIPTNIENCNVWS